MAYRSFEELDVWQRACRQSVSIYNEFDACRKFSLKDQIERAGLSVASNIAEGSERNSAQEFQRFLNIALGSNGELRTQLYIARKLDQLNPETFNLLLIESKEISAMLRGLWQSIEDRKLGAQ
ncbi:MAG: four helix bundle protein [Chthoniobacterales bacterium]|nr:four helix bundle protein [Chthoniobacterales bacterium]